MSADFWAGYISGAIGILVGNPLDVIKTRLQAGPPRQQPSPTVAVGATSIAHQHEQPRRLGASAVYPVWTSFARGAAAPILGYGALNALLFVTYNRSLAVLNGITPSDIVSDKSVTPPAWTIFTAGALGGLATFVVSTPTELVKCRAQVSKPARSSLQVVKEIWRTAGLRGLYLGGSITAVRDAVGYGFYFWSYELSKSALAHEDDTNTIEALKVLLCGGLAGVVTWASIFPLDVIKTRVQTWDLHASAPSTLPTTPNSTSPRPSSLSYTTRTPLLHPVHRSDPLANKPLSPTSTALLPTRPGAFAIARAAYRSEGLGVFFRGLGVCSVRAFIVNAVQWAVYEWTMRTFTAA